MARVTIEDCLEVIPSRFCLILSAAKRAKHLLNTGEDPRVDWENDKATVVALREIAENKITETEINNQLKGKY